MPEPVYILSTAFLRKCMSKEGLEILKQSRIQVGISNAKMGIVICSRDVDVGGGSALGT